MSVSLTRFENGFFQIFHWISQVFSWKLYLKFSRLIFQVNIFSAASVVNYCKFSALKEHKFIIFQLLRPEVHVF